MIIDLDDESTVEELAFFVAAEFDAMEEATHPEGMVGYWHDLLKRAAKEIEQ